MSQVSFTGERLHAGSSLFGVDLARHRAPYRYALSFVGSTGSGIAGSRGSIDSASGGTGLGSGGFGGAGSRRAKRGGARVLDLGCGSGYGTAELADALPRIVGLDRVVHDPENSRDNIDWVRADLRGNPLAPGSFELIVSFQVIEHLEDPHSALALAKKHARVVLGSLPLNHPNKSHIWDFPTVASIQKFLGDARLVQKPKSYRFFFVL